MSKKSDSGIGLAGAVFIVFLVLKLVKVQPVADWSWWWVTCPLWAGLALFVCGAIVVGIIMLITALANK